MKHHLLQACLFGLLLAAWIGWCCKKFLSTPDIEVVANSSPLLIVAKIFFATLPPSQCTHD
jgi:hypothetical protein